MPEISLRQLEVFVAVAEAGGFLRAAEELFLSQSTVSAHVSALEAALGEKLFRRGEHRQTVMTASGQQVYPAAKRILADRDALMDMFADAETDGPLLLGASTVPGQHLLPRCLAAFQQKYPNTRCRLRRGDSAAIHRLCADGEVRLGLVGARLEPERFCYIPLAQDTLVMATQNSARYRELHARGVYGRELLGEPTVAREEGSGTDLTVRNYMRRIGFPDDDLDILARVDDPEAIKRMVAQGVGVSVLSSLAVEHEVEEGRLLAFRMDEDGLRREIYLIYRNDLRLSRTERMFTELLRRML